MTHPRHSFEQRACLATKLAVTAAPCRHGYTWQCPEAADLVSLMVAWWQRVEPIPPSMSREIEKALPWLVERRRGPADRRNQEQTREALS